MSGVIAAEVAAIQIQVRGVELRVTMKGSGAVLEAADNGPGVDTSLGEHIFKRHVQGAPARGSSGLGLYFILPASRRPPGLDGVFRQSSRGRSALSLVPADGRGLLPAPFAASPLDKTALQADIDLLEGMFPRGPGPKYALAAGLGPQFRQLQWSVSLRGWH
jgi:hypothetical protein